mmetsp:Transcript_18919/g.56728  ORF Transcript_18919/g.56728 Transcript_18919/m.56728 type:complete len:283 (-) Transcript_18919:1841-2689(-)
MSERGRSRMLSSSAPSGRCRFTSFSMACRRRCPRPQRSRKKAALQNCSSKAPGNFAEMSQTSLLKSSAFVIASHCRSMMKARAECRSLYECVRLSGKSCDWKGGGVSSQGPTWSLPWFESSTSGSTVRVASASGTVPPMRAWDAWCRAFPQACAKYLSRSLRFMLLGPSIWFVMYCRSSMRSADPSSGARSFARRFAHSFRSGQRSEVPISFTRSWTSSRTPVASSTKRRSPSRHWSLRCARSFEPVGRSGSFSWKGNMQSWKASDLFTLKELSFGALLRST